MQQQIMVIGLGQFGMSLARSLSEKDVEVIGIDVKPEIVNEAADFLTDAVCLDATDEASMAKFHPEEKDSVVCAIGNREASILCTALLRQMGAKFIYSRYLDDMHERILKAVGAHGVINPEQEIGRRFANRIMFRGMLAEEAMSSGLQLNQVCPLPFMIGKTLNQLALPNRYGIIVAAIQHKNSAKIDRPNPNDPINADDRLLLICSEENLTKLLKEK